MKVREESGEATSGEGKVIYIFMDSTEETGSDSIKGVYTDEVEAKVAIADYVLESKKSYDYIELVEKVVTG